MDMQVLGQACACTSAEVHPDIKAVRLYRERQGFLRLSNQLGHFQQFFVSRLVEVRNVPGRRYQHVAVVVGKMIEYYE